jgi:alpha-L-fucosidase
MYQSPVHVPDKWKWFVHDRFGMFIHWGLYALPARHEGVKHHERITDADYQKYFDHFDPDLFDPKAWAKAAKDAGMKYFVITTKHHEGFCLFDSAHTDYKSTNTPCGKDLIRPMVEAFRAEGLKVGFYHSLIDWHHPDFGVDSLHPQRDNEEEKAKNAGRDIAKYTKYLHAQVRELLTNYGKIDYLFFDFSYGDFWGAKWGATELMRKVRALQPDVVVNDRLGREATKEAEPPPYAGDFDQTEMDIPRATVCDQAGRAIPWEAWFTLTNSWCFSATDRAYKAPATIIRALVNCVSKGGNLTLNVSPDARGHLDAETWRILGEVGDWLAANGESIYGCGPAAFPKPEWGRFTQKGNLLYAHVLEPVIGHITLPNLRGRVRNGRVVATGAEALLCGYWNPGIQTFDGPDDIFFNFSVPPQNTWPLPDPRDTVVRFELIR